MKISLLERDKEKIYILNKPPQGYDYVNKGD